jgi:hypothetical protein
MKIRAFYEESRKIRKPGERIYKEGRKAGKNNIAEKSVHNFLTILQRIQINRPVILRRAELN